jgi:hypothetical protein
MSKFDVLAKKVGSPALAAWIGRKKYGKKGMAQKSAAGRRHAAHLHDQHLKRKKKHHH